MQPPEEAAENGEISDLLPAKFLRDHQGFGENEDLALRK
jgi:hypothetical protein